MPIVLSYYSHFLFDSIVRDGWLGTKLFQDETVEKDGVTVDTKTTPKGSYTQPNGGRTDVLQEKPHFNKATKENVGQSHTHEPFSNTNKKTGKTYSGANSNKAHRPTHEEVKNIETGKAKKVN